MFRRYWAITGPFDDLVRQRMAAEPAFRDAVREEALDAIRRGDELTGCLMLMCYCGETDPAADILSPVARLIV